MKCITCYYELPEDMKQCPRCNCWQYKLDDSPEARRAWNILARSHRMTVLQNIDMDILIYRWKDRDGNLCLDRTDCLSFGVASGTLNQRVWLNQKFARIPGKKTMTLQLAVHREQKPQRVMPISVDVPKGSGLLQVGLETYDDLTAVLWIRDGGSECCSVPIEFLME